LRSRGCRSRWIWEGFRVERENPGEFTTGRY
jgi:hypothetical protein